MHAQIFISANVSPLSLDRFPLNLPPNLDRYFYLLFIYLLIFFFI